MGQFLQTNGDYTIKVAEGSNITLDTGLDIGKVRVTGNLVVEGEILTVAARDLQVEDNVIVFNFGETGPGVSLRYSGLLIDRGGLAAGPGSDWVGTLPTEANSGANGPAAIVYDESDDSWIIAHGSPESTWNYFQSKVRLRSILTNKDTDDGDLTLIGTGTGVVKVTGTTAYESQVTDDDDIPNKKYVDDAIQLSPTYQIKSPGTTLPGVEGPGNTRVIIADKDVTPNIVSQPGSFAALYDQTGYNTRGESAVSIIVDGRLVSQFFDNRQEIGNLEIGGGDDNNEITTKEAITNMDIYIRTQGTGKLLTNYAVMMEQLVGEPASVQNHSMIYAADPGIGTSGIWFANDSPEDTKTHGELISKNKALLFSMIF